MGGIKQEGRAVVLPFPLDKGMYRVEWDGLDDRGQGVPTGIYFSTLRAGDFTDMKKMRVLRH